MIRNLVAWAGSQPDAPALIGRGRQIGYGALLRGARAQAGWLHHCGVRAGDIAAIALDAAPDSFFDQVRLFYALGYLGAAILPLYPESALARRGQLAARLNARWLIGAQARDAAPAAGRIDPAQYDAADETWSYAAAPRGDDPARPFLYEFSSGTTGSPRVVLYSENQYASATLAVVREYGWTAGDRVVSALLWPTKVGLRTLIRTHAAGAALVGEAFPETRQRLAQLAGELGVSCIGSTPWQLRRLLASDPATGVRLPPLRCLTTAGAFIAPAEIAAARETLTPNFHVAYACTEIGMIARLRPEDPCDAAPRLIPGLCGEAIDDDDRPLSPGQSGRLRFRAPWMAVGYAGNAQQTGAMFRDGWFYPGDLGSIDADGRVMLHGRLDDVINFGGAKILPRDVEQALAEHPDVADAALIGVSDPMAGMIPVAFIVLRRKLARDEMRRFLAERLDEWQVPPVIIAVPGIPRSAEGKVLRDRLPETSVAPRIKP